MKFFLLLVAGLMLLASCDTSGSWMLNSSNGYVPVYAKVTDVKNIAVEAPKAVTKAGKIYVIGNLLLQNDVNSGVHFIDVSDPKQPVKRSFLRVPYSTEISVKNNYLYVNNYNDLLVFTISDPANPQLVKRLENVFPYHNSEYPPVSNTYFECVDPAKGIVVDWKSANLKDPKCRR